MLLATLDRNEMVPRFLDMYAAEFRRPGRADQPAFYREQLQTIRREAILAMVLRIESSLPKKLSVNVTVRAAKRVKRRKGKKRAKTRPAARPAMELKIPFLDLFREEFFVALGQWLEWSDADAQEFWRDLECYERLNAPARVAGSARSAKGNVSGPFVDRVGHAAGPLADGTSQARSRQISERIECRRRPAFAKSVFFAPRVMNLSRE